MWGWFSLIAQMGFSGAMSPEEFVLLGMLSWVGSSMIVGFAYWYWMKGRNKLGLSDAPTPRQSANQVYLALLVLPIGLVLDLLVTTRLLASPIAYIMGDFWGAAIPGIISIAYVYHALYLFNIELEKERQKQALKKELRACALSERELRRLQKSKVKVTRRRYRPRKPQPADPVTMELNQIRKDLGLH